MNRIIVTGGAGFIGYTNALGFRFTFEQQLPNNQRENNVCK